MNFYCTWANATIKEPTIKQKFVLLLFKFYCRCAERRLMYAIFVTSAYDVASETHRQLASRTVYSSQCTTAVNSTLFDLPCPLGVSGRHGSRDAKLSGRILTSLKTICRTFRSRRGLWPLCFLLYVTLSCIASATRFFACVNLSIKSGLCYVVLQPTDVRTLWTSLTNNMKFKEIKKQHV